MSPLMILAIGLAIVIGGILWLRLHAFVALILAGFAVALLTPADLVRESAERGSSVFDAQFDHEAGVVRRTKSLKKPADYVVAIYATDGEAMTPIGTISPEESPVQDGAGDNGAGEDTFVYQMTLEEDASAEAELFLLKAADLDAAK